MQHDSTATVTDPSIAVVYSSRYDIRALGLERMHPFDTRKHSRAYRLLQSRFGKQLTELVRRVDRTVNENELRTVHTPNYLKALGDSKTVADVLEVPMAASVPAWLIDRLVLRPMRWSTRGTMLAGHAAMELGAAINLAGGFHHAAPDRGEGFCVYADIAVMIHDLWQAEKLDPTAGIVYIDTDAHMGNGVGRCFLRDDRVRILDIYNSAIYPHDPEAERRIDHPIPLMSGESDRGYLDALREALPRFLSRDRNPRGIGLAIYNAGTDVYRGDQLGSLDLSIDAVLERDHLVFDSLTDRGIPWVMLPSGGYSDESHRMIANSSGMAIESRLNP